MMEFDAHKSKNHQNHTNLKLGAKCRMIVLISLASFLHPPSGQTVMKPSRLDLFSQMRILRIVCPLS
jgi:hypothetical protein